MSKARQLVDSGVGVGAEVNCALRHMGHKLAKDSVLRIHREKLIKLNMMSKVN